MINQIEQALKQYIESLPKSRFKDAVSYALLAGGKRLRPLLMLQVIEHYGLDPSIYMDAAIALEMLHTYSLVHDDLPSMDNDTLRRGKPTLHIAYDEGLAILVGDGLLTDCFLQISKQQFLNDKQKVEMIKTLSLKTGNKGMVYGQVLDIESEQKKIDIQLLDQMYEYKTANLLQASLMLGAVASNQFETIPLWEKLGYHLGIYFQIQDDILEHTSTPEILGKSKSDDIREKPTYISIVGYQNALNVLDYHEQHINIFMQQLELETSVIHETILQIKKRKA